jgi:hypothetical protein
MEMVPSPSSHVVVFSPSPPKDSDSFFLYPQIGLEHGRAAADLVKGSIDFYTDYFVKTSQMSWEAASAVAAKFLPFLEKTVPDLVEEMRGTKTSRNITT